MSALCLQETLEQEGTGGQRLLNEYHTSFELTMMKIYLSHDVT